jgi:hypothetical protein
VAKAGGYVLFLDSNRFGVFQDAVDDNGRFAEAVDSFAHSRAAALVCFIVDPKGLITHIARGRRGVNAGTFQSRLNLEDVEALHTRLSINEIINGVPNRNKRAVAGSFQNGGLLTPRAFEATIDLVINLAPEIRGSIERFTASTRERLARLSLETRESLAYQKETVAMALQLAGLDRSPLAEWTLDDEGAPKSFLEGLPQARLREDPMIIQDMRRVPGYAYLEDVPIVSGAVFEDGENRLTVVMANRQPLEEQTGTDLIYYNETFKAFIMVQYKAMDADDKLGAIFRFPETKLTEEIERMDAFLTKLAQIRSSPTTDDFRLNTNPFFLKFCPRVQFEPDSTGLTKGMYIPHSLWKLLEVDNRLKGPKGGRRLAYSNVRRYFDNTSFIAMVRGAWVGTTIPQSKLLEDWMKRVIESGRSITFAVKADDPDGDRASVLVDPNLGLDGMTEDKETETERVFVQQRG